MDLDYVSKPKRWVFCMKRDWSEVKAIDFETILPMDCIYDVKFNVKTLEHKILYSHKDWDVEKAKKTAETLSKAYKHIYRKSIDFYFEHANFDSVENIAILTPKIVGRVIRNATVI